MGQAAEDGFRPAVEPQRGVRATFEIRGEASFAASQHDDGNAVTATAHEKLAHLGFLGGSVICFQSFPRFVSQSELFFPLVFVSSRAASSFLATN
jgi:hypothetical protein